MLDEGLTDEASLPHSLRRRRETTAGSGTFEVLQTSALWDPRRTAFLVCDMWDRHWCAGASRRVDELAPAMNEVLRAARARGVLIIHAPSGTMPFYEGTPQRKRAQEAPNSPAPEDIRSWRYLDPTREPPLPIDDSDGGCDDEPPCPSFPAWTSQHPALKISAEDAVSDDGAEIHNLLQHRSIENVVVMGVHEHVRSGPSVLHSPPRWARQEHGAHARYDG